ncbi:MAG: helix-turn-helix domain-containing protein [Burkholderiaceae bacterium]
MYIGPGLRLAPHHNVAATIAVALGEPFELRAWARSTAWSGWKSYLSALIPSETLHHLKSSGPMVFLYLDPLTDRRHPLSQSQLDSGRSRLLEAGPGIGINEAFARFGLQPKLPSDARIAKVVLEVERRPDAFGRMREAAELASLSPSRFRARFDAEVGLPFRRYRMWRRMSSVMRSIAEGRNLTAAALEAGFSSSAHLSSSFKRMFGLSPSEIIALGVAIDTSEDQVVSRSHTAQRNRETELRTA